MFYEGVILLWVLCVVLNLFRIQKRELVNC